MKYRCVLCVFYHPKIKLVIYYDGLIPKPMILFINQNWIMRFLFYLSVFISANRIRISVFINAGSYEEQLGKEGTAHFLEHLLTSSDTRNQIMARGGYIEDLATAASFIKFDLVIPDKNDNREFAINVVSRFLKGQDITEENFVREKRRILNEIGINDDDPSRYIGTLLGKAFRNERADGNITGTREDVKKLTLEDLRSYLQQFFVGSNIHIGVTGPFAHDTFKKPLEEALRDIPSGSSSLLYQPKVEKPEYRERVEYLKQLYFSFCFPIEQIARKDSYLADMASNYLRMKIQRDVLFKAGIVYSAFNRGIHSPTRSGYFDMRGNIMSEDAHHVFPEIGGVITSSIEELDRPTFDTIKTLAIEGMRNEVFIRPSHNAGGMSICSMMNQGRIFTTAESLDVVSSIEADDVHRFLVDDVFSNAPAIVTYGDDSKLGTYDEFVEPIQAAVAKVRGLCP